MLESGNNEITQKQSVNVYFSEKALVPAASFIVSYFLDQTTVIKIVELSKALQTLRSKIISGLKVRNIKLKKLFVI